MARPTERILNLLGLLQQRPVWTGRELAERLGVTTRSVRRDIERLRELGYPVNAAKGAAGGYQLGRGRALPPLMLDDQEAVAIAVALTQVAAGGDGTGAEAALGVLGKLDQLLPRRLAGQVRAVAEAVSVQPPGVLVDPLDLLTLARACRERYRVRFDYLRRDGESSIRLVEPVQLVQLSGFWYLMAYDLDRADWRTFRLDRIRDLQPSTWRFAPREHPDPLTWVSRSITEKPYPYRAKVIMDCTAARARELVPTRVGTVTAIYEAKCELLVGGVELPWMAMHLARMGIEFTVVEPPELINELDRLGTIMKEAAVRSTQPTKSRARRS